MIAICSGKEVIEFMAKLRYAPWQFSEATICSPFIGEDEAKLIAEIIVKAPKSGCGARVITAPAAAKMFEVLLCNEVRVGRRSVVVCENLHAKFYLALARRACWSEVIVTSANLTSAGLKSNEELGIRARTDCDEGVRLVNNVAHYAQRLAAQI